MIVGKLGTGMEEAVLPKALQIGLAALGERDWGREQPGRYAICGEDIFVLVSDYETTAAATKRPESHSDYIDIQYLVDGGEAIGWRVLDETCHIDEDCRPERDLLFYTSVGEETFLFLEKGMFAVFFPKDVHRPGCVREKPEKVRKAVVKIKVGLVGEREYAFK